MSALNSLEISLKHLSQQSAYSRSPKSISEQLAKMQNSKQAPLVESIWNCHRLNNQNAPLAQNHSFVDLTDVGNSTCHIQNSLNLPQNERESPTKLIEYQGFATFNQVPASKNTNDTFSQENRTPESLAIARNSIKLINNRLKYSISNEFICIIQKRSRLKIYANKTKIFCMHLKHSLDLFNTLKEIIYNHKYALKINFNTLNQLQITKHYTKAFFLPIILFLVDPKLGLSFLKKVPNNLQASNCLMNSIELLINKLNSPLLNKIKDDLLEWKKNYLDKYDTPKLNKEELTVSKYPFKIVLFSNSLLIYRFENVIYETLLNDDCKLLKSFLHNISEFTKTGIIDLSNLTEILIKDDDGSIDFYAPFILFLIDPKLGYNFIQKSNSPLNVIKSLKETLFKIKNKQKTTLYEVEFAILSTERAFLQNSLPHTYSNFLKPQSSDVRLPNLLPSLRTNNSKIIFEEKISYRNFHSYIAKINYEIIYIQNKDLYTVIYNKITKTLMVSDECSTIYQKIFYGTDDAIKLFLTEVANGTVSKKYSNLETSKGKSYFYIPFILFLVDVKLGNDFVNISQNPFIIIHKLKETLRNFNIQSIKFTFIKKSIELLESYYPSSNALPETMDLPQSFFSSDSVEVNNPYITSINDNNSQIIPSLDISDNHEHSFQNSFGSLQILPTSLLHLD